MGAIEQVIQIGWTDSVDMSRSKQLHRERRKRHSLQGVIDVCVEI